jgi:hypothetical protein
MTDRPLMTVIFICRVTSSRVVLYVFHDLHLWTPDAFHNHMTSNFECHQEHDDEK